MTKISFNLPDELKERLEGRVREGAYVDVEAYLRDLIRADLAQDDSSEMTPELEAALAEGETSGYTPYDFKSIVAEARAKFHER